MNDFVRLYYNRFGEELAKNLYEPTEHIRIEADFNSSDVPFDPYMRFNLGIVCNGGIIYNEKGSDGCVRMSCITHRFRINDKVYDFTKYKSNEEALPAFIAMVEENIAPQEVIDVEDIVL